MNDAVKIVSVTEEAYDTKTFSFVWDKECKPGQFVMIWIPGVDEIPMSLSSVEKNKSITVKAIGDATKKLHSLKKNDIIFIRGPYGNGFSIKKEKILVVAGGVGMAAMLPVVMKTGSDVILGARSSNDLIFEKDVSMVSKIWISTDDGSKGFHGNAVQLAKQRLAEEKYDVVMACGPEIMLYHLHKACSELKMKCQMSLERYMKCGAGVCGACMMNENRICADGPVFTDEQIMKMDEFGRYKRDPSGILIKL